VEAIMAKKIIQDVLQHLPACATDFIKQVIKKMHYRKKVRQDVQEELAAHFEDGLRDCKNDTEKEQKAQELINNFGDVKLLAVLLRRAKKRCRPLWLIATLRTLKIAGVLILCITLYAVWFFTGKPVITTNYLAELNRMVRPSEATESLNAAPLYIEAGQRYRQLLQDVNNQQILEPIQTKDYDEITPDKKQLVEKWLVDNEDFLKLIIEGSKRPYCWFTYQISDYAKEHGKDNDLNEAFTPHLSEFMEFKYIFRFIAILKSEKGQFKDALDDIKTFYHLGRHFKGGGSIMEQLIGFNLESASTETIRYILDRYRFDSKLLADFQNDLEKMIADDNFVFSLKTDMLFALDGIQRCFVGGFFSMGHIYLPRLMQIIPDLVAYDDFGCHLHGYDELIYIIIAHPNKKQTLKSLNKTLDYLEKAALKTPAQIRKEQINMTADTLRMIKNNFFLRIITPSGNQLFYRSYVNRIDVEATLTILAIIRYKQDKGRCPENLEQLVTEGYLKQIPIDPFSDKPLVYKQKDGDFILYSYGRNCVDDGGQGETNKGTSKRILWKENGDAVFWPMQ
jgi:hypothetical protein